MLTIKQVVKIESVNARKTMHCFTACFYDKLWLGCRKVSKVFGHQGLTQDSQPSANINIICLADECLCSSFYLKITLIHTKCGGYIVEVTFPPG